MNLPRNDGTADLIRPFEELGRRIVHRWSPDHVEAALPGRRSRFPRSLHKEAWRTLFELSRYAREGTLPLYPCGKLTPEDRISPSVISVIYPLYPASKPSSRGRGLVELADGSMVEAVADVTGFSKQVRADHPPLPPMGRPLEHQEYLDAAKAFWQANGWPVKSGVVIEHIRSHRPDLHASVPFSSRYRLVEKARMDVFSIN